MSTKILTVPYEVIFICEKREVFGYDPLGKFDFINLSIAQVWICSRCVYNNKEALIFFNFLGYYFFIHANSNIKNMFKIGNKSDIDIKYIFRNNKKIKI